MSMINPKAVFIQTEDTAKKELSIVVNSSNFQKALTFALAHWSVMYTPTSESAQSVVDFIGVLTSLPEEERPVKSMQAKTLDHGLLKNLKPSTP